MACSVIVNSLPFACLFFQAVFALCFSKPLSFVVRVPLCLPAQVCVSVLMYLCVFWAYVHTYICKSEAEKGSHSNQNKPEQNQWQCVSVRVCGKAGH